MTKPSKSKIAKIELQKDQFVPSLSMWQKAMIRIRHDKTTLIAMGLSYSLRS